jgi:hypothetical protein
MKRRFNLTERLLELEFFSYQTHPLALPVQLYNYYVLQDRECFQWRVNWWSDIHEQIWNNVVKGYMVFICMHGWTNANAVFFLLGTFCCVIAFLHGYSNTSCDWLVVTGHEETLSWCYTGRFSTTIRNANEVGRDLIGLAARCGANCR